MYGQSKLIPANYAEELSRRFAARRINVDAVHAGAVRGTALNRGLAFPLNIVLRVASLFMKSVEQDDATQAYLAANPAGRVITGKYCRLMTRNRRSTFARMLALPCSTLCAPRLPCPSGSLAMPLGRAAMPVHLPCDPRLCTSVARVRPHGFFLVMQQIDHLLDVA